MYLLCLGLPTVFGRHRCRQPPEVQQEAEWRAEVAELRRWLITKTEQQHELERSVLTLPWGVAGGGVAHLRSAHRLHCAHPPPNKCEGAKPPVGRGGTEGPKFPL